MHSISSHLPPVPPERDASEHTRRAEPGAPSTEALRERAWRASAMALVEARGHPSRRDPTSAQRAWSELLDGVWRLVDHFERDRRTYLVARRSVLRAGARSMLTAAETVCAIYVGMGHSQKLISAELGVSESTTSTHVRNAMRKLGLTSRADLARIFGTGRAQ